MKLLNNLKLTDIRGKIINTKDVKIKIIQKILFDMNRLDIMHLKNKCWRSS
jgi:hypothetical protein